MKKLENLDKSQKAFFIFALFALIVILFTWVIPIVEDCAYQKCMKARNWEFTDTNCEQCKAEAKII